MESVRETGSCVARRVVRVIERNVDDDGELTDSTWHAEERDGRSGDWRALGNPRETPGRSEYSCTAAGSLVYVIGGHGDWYPGSDIDHCDSIR